MRNITQEQASTVIRQMHDYVRSTQDLVEDPTQLFLYHTLPHTIKVGSMASHFAYGFGLDITDAWAATIAASGHDADIVTAIHETSDSPHPAFKLTRIRDISGTTEDTSAERVARACADVGIGQSDIEDIMAADKATTISFENGEIRQPRIRESGNWVLNFVVAKPDIAHIIPLRTAKEKQQIAIRLWLERYPQATAQLLDGTFSITDEDFEWIRGDLGYFLDEVQFQFAKSQYRQLFEDAELCQLPARAMDFLAMTFSEKVQKKHIDTMYSIAGTVVASPTQVVRALNDATAWLRQTRKYKHSS